MRETPRVFDFFNDPAGLGLFDPVILGLMAGVAVLSALALALMPKRQAKMAAKSAPGAQRHRATSIVPQTLPARPAVAADLPASTPTAAGGLARLRTIIEAGTAHSEKISAAHAGASLKLDAAEHALNRMILDVKTVLDIRPAPAPTAAVEVHDVVHGGGQRGARGTIAA
jgi:hypothetical protein